MKFTIAVLLSFLAGTAVGLIGWMPWWGFAVSSLLVAVLLPQQPSKAFAAGFLGMFLSWGGLSWWIDWQNAHILSRQIAQLFPLQGSSASLILITGLLGGLISGLAALSGAYLRASKKED